MYVPKGVYVCVICITSLIQEEEGPEVVMLKEEGLGNAEGTMVMEDNQTTPPEPTEEPAEQNRTTHSLTEVSPLWTTGWIILGQGADLGSV